MKKSIFKKIEWFIYILIPFITICLFRILKVAQGEKNEEIVVGIMIGILIDVIYAIFNYFISKGKK